MTVLIRTASDARAATQTSRTLIRSPAAFDGTLEDFIERYILPDLPTSSVVTAFHHALAEYVAQPDALFLLRAVRGTERRVTYRTNDGTRFEATDNAPAWWVHAMLAQGYEIAPGAFREVVKTIPAHLFDVRSSAAPTANAAAWHVAHILPVKDGDTDYPRWRRADVVRRFVRSVHPCNYFPIAKAEWQRWGGNERVIARFAALYTERYATVWPAFLTLAGASEHELPRVTGIVAYEYDSRDKKGVASPLQRRATASAEDEDDEAYVRTSVVASTSRGVAAAEYTASRLSFRRDVIEALREDDAFRVVTPHGTFEMTRAEFHDTFAKVVASRSYREAGLYHYPTVPRRAERFRQ